jgi:membrane-bound metal-dependent hydrolase YbcI (DUF457 family)
MPITPFHLGPGAALKSFAPKHVSFTIFLFTQILIDLESIYFFMKNDWPVHRFFHSYLGATVVVVIGIVIGRPICQWLLKKWNAKLSKKQKEWLYVEPIISMKSAIIGLVLGAYSHIFLDSIMHSDIKPFSPFTDRNGMHGIITIDQLDLFCVLSGIVGVLILAGYRVIKKRHKNVVHSDG